MGGVLGQLLSLMWAEQLFELNAVLDRYYHAAVCIPTLHAILVFGGLSAQSGALREMWSYNLDSSRWRKLEVPENSIQSYYSFVCNWNPAALCH